MIISVVYIFCNVEDCLFLFCMIILYMVVIVIFLEGVSLFLFLIFKSVLNILYKSEIFVFNFFKVFLNIILFNSLKEFFFCKIVLFFLLNFFIE